MPIRRSILILVIIAACLASYFNSLFGSFVWDDNTFFATKEYNRSFRFLPKFFTKDLLGVYDQSLSGDYYRPFLALSFMLNYALWEGNPFGYHIVNFIFHILCCISIFVFVEMLIQNRIIAFSSALLFGVHPIHTEAVSFISNISYVSATFFFILSIILFLIFAQYRRLIFYLFSLICFSISLLTIESTITLPLVLICIDYLFLSQNNIKKLIKNFFKLHLGFFVIIILYLVVRSYAVGWDFSMKRAFMQTNFNDGTGSLWRVSTAIKLFAYYIRILFVPYGLRVEYFFVPSNSFFEPEVLAGIALFILLIFLAIKNIKHNAILSFSIVWFFITFLPISNMLPTGNIFAERYMYIPSVGFCIGIGFLLSRILQKKIKTNFLNWEKSCALVFMLLIIALGRVTYERNKAWENDLTLWFDAVKKSPQSSRAHLNLSVAYCNLGLWDKALNEINASLNLNPFSSEAIFTLGDIYLNKGSADEAVMWFNKTINILPAHSRSYLGLSAAYYLKQQYQQAIEAGLMALEKNPFLDQTHYNLALSYTAIGLIDEAINRYEEYLKTNPNNAAIHVDVGHLYHKKSDYQKAKSHWFLALNISPNYQPAKDALKLLEN